ncbi:hypothetical protein [Bradyrhizobium sp. USDA 4508]
MADWYASSVAYAAIPTYQTGHAYSVGDIIRPTSPTFFAQYPQRCTTAGTSGGTEPAWSTSNNGTTTTNGTVFTNVGGQSTYGWAAACGTVASLSTNSNKALGAGDRVFVSSDHSETNGAGACSYRMTSGSGYSAVKIISVNRAGSVPPVSADIQTGASITFNGTATFDPTTTHYWEGLTFTQTANANITFNGGSVLTNYYKNSKFVFTNASGGSFTSGNPAKVVFDNTTVQFSNAASRWYYGFSVDLTWLNTPSAIVSGTLPSALFGSFGGAMQVHTLRGVDVSAITGTLLTTRAGDGGMKILLDSCKINSGVTRYSSSGSTQDELDLVNCYDGTKIVNERYTTAGSLTTDTSTYMTNGAADDVGNFSHKIVSTTNVDLTVNPFESFWLDVENMVVGSVLTATVELVSSASLNNADIKLQLEYQGTSGSSLATFAESNANILTASSSLTSSSATWNSPPSTPSYQKLQISFTPQQAGRVRARVLLGKTSKTLWINPQITIQ